MFPPTENRTGNILPLGAGCQRPQITPYLWWVQTFEAVRSVKKLEQGALFNPPEPIIVSTGTDSIKFIA